MGFYERGASLKKGLFLWVTFTPLLGVVLLLWRAFRPTDQRVSVVTRWFSVVYLGGALLAFPVSFWRMSGALW